MFITNSSTQPAKPSQAQAGLGLNHAARNFAGVQKR